MTTAEAITPGTRPISSTASRLIRATTRYGPACSSTCAMTLSFTTLVTMPVKWLRIESVLATDDAVAESAVVGIPDATKGEAVWAFWIPRAGATDADGDEDDGVVSARLKALVAAQVGKPFAPARVVRVAQLPKTRSAKIMRRAIRAAVLDTDPGDLSGAENPEAVEDIRSQVKEVR